MPPAAASPRWHHRVRSRREFFHIGHAPLKTQRSTRAMTPTSYLIDLNAIIMVTVKAPESQKVRKSKHTSSTSSIRVYLKLAMLFLVVAALAVYVNLTLLRHHNNKHNSVYSTVPEEYWYLKKWELEDFLGCEEIIEAGRPVHSHEDWVSLRNAYRDIVGKEKSTLLPDDNIDGFNVRIVSKISPGRGRGVFAEEDIKRGTLVWTQKHQSAQFRRGYHFRKFLATIPPEMACDVLMWAYVHDLNEAYWDVNDENKYDLVINCDLDEGSFINSGGWKDGAKGNIGCIDEFSDKYARKYLPEYSDSGCPENLFALRDIKAGEEILCKYADFAIPKGWMYLGL